MQYMLTHTSPEIILPPHEHSTLSGTLDLLNFTLNTLWNLIPIPTIKQVFGDTVQETVQILHVFIG